MHAYLQKKKLSAIATICKIYTNSPSSSQIVTVAVSKIVLDSSMMMHSKDSSISGSKSSNILTAMHVGLPLSVKIVFSSS